MVTKRVGWSFIATALVCFFTQEVDKHRVNVVSMSWSSDVSFSVCWLDTSFHVPNWNKGISPTFFAPQSESLIWKKRKKERKDESTRSCDGCQCHQFHTHHQWTQWLQRNFWAVCLTCDVDWKMKVQVSVMMSVGRSRCVLGHLPVRWTAR